MVFSSLIFLCAFLPAVLALYAICPKKWRSLLLTVASLFFYAWGEPKYIFIMLFSIVFDYINGRAIEYFAMRNEQGKKKLVLLLSIAGNLGILFFFKYTDMIINSWNQLTASEIDVLALTLPIGISFYTFQTMSYTIDVYCGRVKAQKNLISFSMYVSMFPQLIAGPIVRYQWIESQLQERVVGNERFVKGMHRFLIGLGKKVIFANQIGALWTEISGGAISNLSAADAWLGALAYTFQIYFDFSGYSDMAIGLGDMFGFSFPENFQHPYEAGSVTEFWRRWHITLGSWFRSYIYIPLGGNRKGLPRQIFNLFVVWLLTGLWHGASWNFAIWGIYFFVLLLLEKTFLLKEMEHWHPVFCHLYAKICIVVGWVIFALEDFGKMGQYLQIMLGVKHPFLSETALYHLKTYGIFFLVLAVSSTQIPIYLLGKLKEHMRKTEPEFMEKKGEKVEFLINSIFTLLILLISMGFLVRGSYNPFLYFRF